MVEGKREQQQQGGRDAVQYSAVQEGGGSEGGRWRVEGGGGQLEGGARLCKEVET